MPELRTFLHQEKLIAILGETVDSFYVVFHIGPLSIRSKLIILQNEYRESGSQLYKRKYEWERNLTSLYLQSVELRVTLILLKPFSIPFLSK